VDAIVCGATLVYVTRGGGFEAQSLALAAPTVPVRLVDAPVPFATGQDSIIRRPFGGHVLAPDDRELDWGSIERWARAIRSRSLNPRISQSARLTVTYRRPMGARLGIIVNF
jgi:hypothetical protein